MGRAIRKHLDGVVRNRPWLAWLIRRGIGAIWVTNLHFHQRSNDAGMRLGRLLPTLSADRDRPRRARSDGAPSDADVVRFLSAVQRRRTAVASRSEQRMDPELDQILRVPPHNSSDIHPHPAASSGARRAVGTRSPSPRPVQRTPSTKRTSNAGTSS